MWLLEKDTQKHTHQHTHARLLSPLMGTDKRQAPSLRNRSDWAAGGQLHCNHYPAATYLASRLRTRKQGDFSHRVAFNTQISKLSQKIGGCMVLSVVAGYENIFQRITLADSETDVGCVCWKSNSLKPNQNSDK